MLEKFVEANYLSSLTQMGYTKKQIDQRIKKRLLKATIILALFSLLAIATKQILLFGVGLFLSFMIFKLDAITLKKDFERFSLERELAFGRFMQLIIPYLKAEQGKDSLYIIFSKLIPRLGPALQSSVFMLMNEMVSNPESPDPFLNFAQRSSNDDVSVNFMLALYDYQRFTTDLTVIEELSETANKQLFNRVDDIIKIKNKRVEKYPLIMAVCMSIIMVPFLLAYLLYVISNSGLF